MSGNPYFGKTNTEAYNEATHEIANELHVARMNELHIVRKAGESFTENDDDA